MLKNHVVGAALAAALCFTLVGCSSGNIEQSQPSPQNSTQSATPSNESETSSINSNRNPEAATDPITIGRAKEIAFEDAGVSEDDVALLKAKLEIDDGVRVYELDFATAEAEWEYEISADDGRILERTTEHLSIATDEASKIAADAALSDAGVNSGNATFIKIKTDMDDGIQVYEIEFVTADTKYDYEIAVSDNRIIKSERESLEIAKEEE